MNTNRDSFDVRIDDDLFEVIVSYLPIKDKLRYESVSKRFQRFVFNKQKILRINDYKDFVIINNLKNGVLVNDCKYLTILLKKFQFITTLEIDYFFDEFLETITEYCNHLTSITISCYNIDLEALKRFCGKFGQLLRHISIIETNGNRIGVKDLRTLLNILPKLSSISDIPFQYLSSEPILEKLVKLDTTFFGRYPELTNVILEKLVNLKYLSISFIGYSSDYHLFQILSKYLKNLKVFKIRAYTQTFNKSDIESIATNCRYLEYFSLDINDQNVDEKQCFRSLVQFSGLRKLCFRNTFGRQITEQITDLTPLKNCKNLLNLNLELFAINRNVFNGIELIDPQLRQLCLNCPNLEIRDEVLESIAKLKYLTQIQIKCNTNKIRADGLRVLINGCEFLESFSFISSLYFIPIDTNQRINKLIENHPNIRFEFKRKGFDY